MRPKYLCCRTRREFLKFRLSTFLVPAVCLLLPSSLSAACRHPSSRLLHVAPFSSLDTRWGFSAPRSLFPSSLTSFIVRFRYDCVQIFNLPEGCQNIYLALRTLPFVSSEWVPDLFSLLLHENQCEPHIVVLRRQW